MSDARLGRAPRSEAEWAREIDRRLKKVERSQTTRVGNWVLSEQDGRPVLTRPGESMEVGAAAEPEVVDLSQRGTTVTDLSDIATAVGYPDVDPEAPPSLDDVRQWVLAQLFGTVSPSRIPSLPWAHLADGSAELLEDPSFDNPATFANNPSLHYDSAFGRLKPGSARVAADGSTFAGVSNLIPVEAGEILPVSLHVFYEGVVATVADPIKLGVRGYHVEDDGTRTLVTTATVDSIAAPSGESDDVPEAVDGWIKLQGSYTVPTLPTSVDEVVLGFDGAGITAGSIWFDDGSAKKVKDGLPQEWIKNLVGDLGSLWNGLGGFVEQLMAQLGMTPSGVFWDDVFDLSDEIAWIQERAAEGVQDAAEALTNLATLANNLLHNPGAVLGQIGQDMVEHLEDDLADAGDAIADVFDDIRDTWNRIVGGYRRTAVTGQTSQDVEEIMVSVGQEILVAQESTITLANQANAPKNVSYWETPNPFEDVSFPRALLQPVPGYSLAGFTTGTPSPEITTANWNASARSDYNSHTHSISGGTLTPTWSKPLYTIAAGTLALSAVRVKQDRLINIARFIAGGDTPPPTALYVGLYAIDPQTGNMALVHNFGDMKGDITTGAGLYETPCELPADVLVDAGTLFAIGILPVGGSFTVAAIRRQPITTSALIYPQAATELLTSQSTLPSTIAESALTHTATHRIWVSVGQAVESTPEDVSPVTLSMNFDVSNTSSWSSPSFQQFGTSGSRFGIESGAIYCASDPLVIGEEVHWRSALCLTPVHTNDHSVKITLATQFNASTYGYTTTRAYVRCNNTGTSGVAMHLDSNSSGNLRIRIANISNMTSLGTVRATATTTFAPGDDIEIRATGSLYKVYKNGVAVPGAEWDDTDEIVPVGKAWRRHGFGLGNRNVSAFTTYRTAYIDRYVAADLVA
ncbi:minor tail protein [Mycobacterium phage Mask]|nr:minor tail protein [Mycobacterium phage Sejanus]UVT31560.1 minor tail protein [Mycobacterium phage Mask]